MYYFPSGSLSFGTCWAFDKTGKLLWTGPGTSVTDTMVQGWINSSGGGGGGTNNPPVANAGADQNVFEGATVVLSGSSSTDPDGDPLTYSWTQTAGATVTLQNANSVSASFVAPTAGAGRSYTFQLTVSDGQGGSDTDSVTVNATPSNYPPNANAGPDQGVKFGLAVQLNASASTDPDGDPMTFSWAQVSGPSVTLTSPNTVNPTFTSPATPAKLVFTVTVTDTSGASDNDEVTVHVNATGEIPFELSKRGTGGGAGCSSRTGSSFALYGILALIVLATLPRRRRA